ncbi:MAG TPA: hypothetical protein VMU39_08100 [Solirubrobacteraceae bacterium]|nr:hypothetical protein [Solirubrobacteraceae bacterium]
MLLSRSLAARASACAFVCAAAALLTGSPAHAAGGAWPNLKGIQHLHFQTAPIDVKPGQNTIDNIIIPADEKPKVDGFIIRAKPNLEYLNGKVPPVDVIHLHHGVWLNASGTSPAAPLGSIQPIFFGGEEKTVFRIPEGYGYAYKATDTWILNRMIHNNTPNATKVRLVWDLDFIPASSTLAKHITPVVPLWMDVRRGWGYPVFNVIQGQGGSGGTFTFPDDAKANPYAGGNIQNEFRMPFSGTIVSAVGHLHPGGLYDDIDLVRPGATLPATTSCAREATDATGAHTARVCVRATAGSVKNSVRIFRSQAHYYDPAGPVSWDVSLTASRPDWRVHVRTNDVLRITSTYDNSHSSWYEDMGIVLLFVAENDSRGPDPFATPVDWRGVLTHGHLPENNNHGGDQAVFPDPRKVASGPVTTTVDIKGFQFQPGDLGLLSDGGKVPVVPEGQSLHFHNDDNPAFEWHSITTCAAPCNRNTGISYPLANGGSGTQFDSGQLGYGPAGLSPADNTLDYSTPTDLPPGTYTYFCRVHAFMRGSFRVVKPAG